MLSFWCSAAVHESGEGGILWLSLKRIRIISALVQRLLLTSHACWQFIWLAMAPTLEHAGSLDDWTTRDSAISRSCTCRCNDVTSPFKESTSRVKRIISARFSLQQFEFPPLPPLTAVCVRCSVLIAFTSRDSRSISALFSPQQTGYCCITCSCTASIALWVCLTCLFKTSRLNCPVAVELLYNNSIEITTIPIMPMMAFCSSFTQTPLNIKEILKYIIVSINPLFYKYFVSDKDFVC